MADKKETALATKGVDVRTMYDVITERLKTIKKETDTPFKTSGVIDYLGEKFDIKRTQSLQELILVASELRAAERQYNEMAEKLVGATWPQFQVNGHSVDDIIHDVEIRIRVIQYEQEKKKHEKYQSKLRELFTEEDKKAALLEELQKEFGIE